MVFTENALGIVYEKSRQTESWLDRKLCCPKVVQKSGPQSPLQSITVGLNQGIRMPETRAQSLHRIFAKDLKKSYKGRQVVRGVSLELLGGEVVGLLGPNGAGKTTIFDMVVGLCQPDHGKSFSTTMRLPLCRCISGRGEELDICHKKLPYFDGFPLRIMC